MDATEKKRAAAREALKLIEPGTKLGMGTGSTVNCLIEILGEGSLSIDDANAVIMAARAHWFDDLPAEAQAPDTAAEAEETVSESEPAG